MLPVILSSFGKHGRQAEYLGLKQWFSNSEACEHGENVEWNESVACGRNKQNGQIWLSLRLHLHLEHTMCSPYPDALSR